MHFDCIPVMSWTSHLCMNTNMAAKSCHQVRRMFSEHEHKLRTLLGYHTASAHFLWICRAGITCTHYGIAVLYSDFSSMVNARMGPRSLRSTLLLSFPMLPAPHVLEGSCRGIGCHQPISHPLVNQGGVRGHSTQQHREASVQHLADAANQTKPQLQQIWTIIAPSSLLSCVTFCGSTIDEKAVEELFGWVFLPSPSLPAKQPAAQDVWHRTRLSTDALKKHGKQVGGFTNSWSPTSLVPYFCPHQSCVLMCQIHPL